MSKRQKLLPEEFVELKKIHNSLCTIYTFLCSRKHVISTVDGLRPSVERDIGRPLSVSDLAKIKALIPDDVFFDYVDENQINMESGPTVSANGYVSTERDVFELKADQQRNRQLLVFEFIDGRLYPDKRKNAKAAAGISNAGALFSIDHMKALIEKRRTKFDKAISNFSLHDTDQNLEEIAQAYVPKPIEFTDPIEAMDGLHHVDCGTTLLDMQTFINGIISNVEYKGQIVLGGRFEIESKKAEFEKLEVQYMSVHVKQALEQKDIHELYSHQISAIDAIHKGQNVIVATSTSSGKSLIYQLPVIESLVNNDGYTAMYIFPTKALAQDQKRSFQELLLAVSSIADCQDPFLVDTYDGDTPEKLRASIRTNGQVIFTNPDMIHSSILPSWKQWSHYLRSLKYIVVDELHVYNGIFGSHVAFIMRRLRRICKSLGNDRIQVISCSATIRNPVDLMSTLFGVEQESITLIDQDGSPMGNKHILIWNTPFISPRDPKSGRVHPVAEAATLFIELISRGVRTIAFCKFRRACEMLIKSIRTRLEQDENLDVGLASRVMSYRGGYSVEDRRRIEKEMFNGELLGIVATNALELGIDIGNLDAVLVVGFPFSISNFRQQVGRAGRRSKDSLAILIGGGDPVDQFYMTNPNQIFEMDNPAVVVALDNVLIVESHVQCAAFELPITRTEIDELIEGTDIDADQLLINRLEKVDDDIFGCHDRFLPWPSKHVSIRGVCDQDQYAVVDITNDRNVVIETVESDRTSFTLYEGGIFLHQGYPYLIEEFNPDEKLAKVVRVDVDWITRARDYTDVDALDVDQVHNLCDKNCAKLGEVKITAVVFGFFKFDKRDRIIDAVEVNVPPVISYSRGFWIDVKLETLQLLQSKQLSISGAIHGAEHAIMSLMPMYVSALPQDVRTECKAPEKEFSQRQSKRKRPPRLIFYDAQQQTGICAKAFEFVNTLIDQAVQRIDQCQCDYGCPECVASTTCKEHSMVVSKIGARVILGTLAGMAINEHDIPQGPEQNLKGLISTQTIDF